MTASSFLAALVPLIQDLSRELSDAERYRRLLETMRALFPADATALLRLEGGTLVPLAIDGLSSDTLGRRFKVDEHVRFARVLARHEPTRFASDCDLPDPYDGLVKGDLDLHDCLGCPLVIEGKAWGLLTLDSLDPERFDQIDMRSLDAFLSLAAATVSVAERIDVLARTGEEERRRADAYRHASGQGTRAMLGNSRAHKRLMEEIRIVGNTDLTVLITGETGVGKELVANAIHALSARSGKPMISINCAALPDTLAESELFGHVRGAFSGATSDRRGKFELAHGGTLFLDEVGELSMTVQAKLLRVLQNGQLQRVGSDSEHRVDVRVIAASNRDLADEVRAGRLRADFYHRLSVYPLIVPPLRERGRDVLIIAGTFLEENRSRLGLSSLRLAADAQDALLDYTWPGNVRELEHLVGRTSLKALAAQMAYVHHASYAKRPRMLTLTAADFNLDAMPRSYTATAELRDGHSESGERDYRSTVALFERSLLNDTLTRLGGNWASTARELNLDRANLNRLAKRLGLK